VEIAYAGNGRYAPTCIRFRKAVERGDLEFEDYSNFQMSLRFLAGALGAPFIPTRSGLGSDILEQKGFEEHTRSAGRAAKHKYVAMQNPFCDDKDEVVLLPALLPDVALIHAQQVGDDGTVRIDGLTFSDLEQAKAARTVIVSCEEIVDSAALRRSPDQNSLPSFLVDAIVEAPYGAHPTACFGRYDYDPEHLRRYGEAAKDDDRFSRYLEEWIVGSPSHEAYLAHVGAQSLDRIKASPGIGYAIGLKR
jgi:glutaconate CoA-transferase subunit A